MNKLKQSCSKPTLTSPYGAGARGGGGGGGGGQRATEYGTLEHFTVHMVLTEEVSFYYPSAPFN